MTDAPSVVVDIGGTNTRVACCANGHIFADSIRRFLNADHSGLEPILDAYLADLGQTPAAVCIDMAGPVEDGVGTLTNLDWRIDADALRQRSGAGHVTVLNDLQAQGYAVPRLGEDSLLPILPGRTLQSNVHLVLNVGTGLNAAPVYTMPGRTLVPPAEAGHITLQAHDGEELRLLDWMRARHPTPGLEDVLSGRGLERLHAWVCTDEQIGTPRGAAAIMQAFSENDPQAVRTVRLFTRFLGRYAGDLALITLPVGGIYLVGGVTRHLGPHLLDLGFAEAFTDKGRFGPFMSQFPVHQVTDDYAALRGCAAHLDEAPSSTP